jgi:hypothetical protein
MVEFILLWYTLGFISMVLILKLNKEDITLDNLISCFSVGIGGVFIFCMLVFFIVRKYLGGMYSFYESNKHKKIF